MNSPLARYLLNSVKLVSATVVCALAVAVPAAYALSRLRFRSTWLKSLAMLGLLAVQLIVSRVLLQSSFLGHVRDALPLASLQHFAPGGVLGRVTYAAPSAAVAALVLVAWVVAALAAGAWRTRTQDV